MTQDRYKARRLYRFEEVGKQGRNHKLLNRNNEGALGICNIEWQDTQRLLCALYNVTLKLWHWISVAEYKSDHLGRYCSGDDPQVNGKLRPRRIVIIMWVKGGTWWVWQKEGSSWDIPCNCDLISLLSQNHLKLGEDRPHQLDKLQMMQSIRIRFDTI